MAKIGKVSDIHKFKCDSHRILIVFWVSIEIVDVEEIVQTSNIII